MNIKTLFLFICYSCFSSVTTLYAQVVINGNSGFNHDVNNCINSLSIPRDFTYNREPLLALYDDETNIGKLFVYDENINLIKTIDFNKNYTFDYELTYQEEQRDVSSVNISNKYETDLNKTYKEFISMNNAANVYFTITEETNGDSLLLLDIDNSVSYNPSSFYFNYDYFGKKYPRRVWRCKSGKMYQYDLNYTIAYTDWTITGTRSYNNKYDLNFIRLCNINLNYGNECHDHYFIASQTLFNEDEEFEYIIPKCTLSTEGIPTNYSFVGSSEEYIVETHRSVLVSDKACIALKGFQVVSANGDIIKDLDFDMELHSSILDRPLVNVVTIGTKTYLAFSGYVENKPSTFFYLVDKETSDIKEVKSTIGQLFVNPNIVDKESSIKIYTDENTADSEIIVASATGGQLKRIKIPAGQKVTNISLNGASGVYNLVQIQNGYIKSRQKVILK